MTGRIGSFGRIGHPYPGSTVPPSGATVSASGYPSTARLPENSFDLGQIGGDRDKPTPVASLGTNGLSVFAPSGATVEVVVHRRQPKEFGRSPLYDFRPVQAFSKSGADGHLDFPAIFHPGDKVEVRVSGMRRVVLDASTTSFPNGGWFEGKWDPCLTRLNGQSTRDRTGAVSTIVIVRDRESGRPVFQLIPTSPRRGLNQR